MVDSNVTSPHPSTFILLGIEGQETEYGWISIPFCSVYILSLLGNGLLLAVIKMEQSLHEPMYLFLSMLSVTRLVITSTILPKTLFFFWFKDRDIHIDVCLAQMYVFHSLTTMESGFIVAMAFNRYITICNPLRHSAILNRKVITKVGLAVVLRGFLLLAPYPFLLKSLPYCETVISHTFCEYNALIKLSCVNTSAYNPFLVFFVAMVDTILIALSYILILRAVFKLPSKEAHLTPLSTCVPHFCTMIVACTSGISAFFMNLFGHSVPPYVHVIVANFYSLSAPLLDPFIYGFKTKKIQKTILSVIFSRGFTFSPRGKRIVIERLTHGPYPCIYC